MEREADGHFSVVRRDGASRADATGSVSTALDDSGLRRPPDPASRWQPDGPHEPSAYVDPARVPLDRRRAQGPAADRPGHLRDARRHVHAGRHVARGGRASSTELARIGITVIEMMPIAEFPGRFGWGYDGVDLYAPGAHLRHARRSARVRRSRARARHRRHPRRRLQPPRARRQLPGGLLARLLHRQVHERLGAGDQLRRAGAGARATSCRTPATGSRSSTSTACASTRRRTSRTRRRATSSPTSCRRRARRPAACRSTSSPRTSRRTRSSCAIPRAGGYGVDALWNDDAHHAAVVALTGRREAYYRDYLGSAQELISCARFGYLYQGQWYSWQTQRRGTPALDLLPSAFVSYLENHDQVANSAYGKRLHHLASPARPSRDDRVAAARAGDADAVPGTGILVVGAVPLLRGPQPGARRGGRAAGGSSSWRSSRA